MDRRQSPHEPEAGEAEPRLATFGERALALVLDIVPVFLLVGYLLVHVLLPRYHPEFIERFDEFVQQAREQEDLDSVFIEARDFVQLWFLWGLWGYFVISEWVWRGTTLGKRIVGLRIVGADQAPPRLFATISRNAMKAFCLLIPLFWVNFLVPLLNRKRRAGHDWLVRSEVYGRRSSKAINR